jgi:hypothetical protein
MKEKEKKMEKKKEMAFAVSCRDPGIYRSAGITNGSRKCKKPDTGNNEDPAEPDIGRDQLFFLRIIQRKELDVQ